MQDRLNSLTTSMLSLCILGGLATIAADVAASKAISTQFARVMNEASVVDGRGPAWRVHVIDSGLSGGDGVRLLDVDNDGDGRVDVVSCTEGDSRRVLVHFAPTKGDYADSAAWTTVEFPESLAGKRKWMFAIALDVNEDGHLDIVAGGKGTGAKVAWFEAPETNKRDLSQWGFHEMSNAGWIMSVIPQDMDGDGDTDIVISDRRPDGGLQGARWLENPAPGGDQTGPWTNHFISEVGDHTDFMALADMDGDGDLDALTTEENFGPDSLGIGAIWYENPKFDSLSGKSVRNK